MAAADLLADDLAGECADAAFVDVKDASGGRSRAGGVRDVASADGMFFSNASSGIRSRIRGPRGNPVVVRKTRAGAQGRG